MNPCPLAARAIAAMLFAFLVGDVQAQVAINESGANPDPSALLDVVSTDRGLLIPRMTTPQRDEIDTPATGLLIYNIETDTFDHYDGAGWTSLLANVGVLNSLAIGGTLRTSRLEPYQSTEGSNSIQMLGTTLTDRWINFRMGGASPAGKAGIMLSRFSDSHFFMYNNATLNIAHSNEDSDSPDVDNASILMRMSSTGEVGYGGAALIDRVNVAGNIRMEDGHQAAGFIPVSDEDGTMTWTDPATITAAPDGDSDPTNELQYLGSFSNGTDRTITITGGTGTTFSVADNDNDPANELDSKWAINGNDISNINSGYVGIGTPNPSTILDINGSIRIRGGGAAAGKVLTAIDASGNAAWMDVNLPIQSSFLAGLGLGTSTDTTNTWRMFGNEAPPVTLRGNGTIIVITSFSFRVSSGSGTDDPNFRIRARTGTPGNYLNDYSGETGLIENYDQHRSNWQLVTFHRTINITQGAGEYVCQLEVHTGSADEDFDLRNQEITVLPLNP